METEKQRLKSSQQLTEPTTTKPTVKLAVRLSVCFEQLCFAAVERNFLVETFSKYQSQPQTVHARIKVYGTQTNTIFSKKIKDLVRSKSQK